MLNYFIPGTALEIGPDSPRLHRTIMRQPKCLPRKVSELNAKNVCTRLCDHMSPNDIGKVASDIHNKMVSSEVEPGSVFAVAIFDQM